jgi:hypothetical protein
MSQHLAKQRSPFALLVMVVVAVGLLAPVSSAAPLVDDTLQTLTCTGLLQGGEESDGDELLHHLWYCHQEASVTTCTPDGEGCTTSASETNEDGSVDVEVTGVADPGGVMALAVGRTQQAEACGQPLYMPVNIRFESEGVGELIASHRIAKTRDQETPQNGVDNIGVCYQSPKPFVDAEGATTMSGLLPLCDATGQTPPCILSRHKNKADAILTMKLPSGDPTWKMVEDTIDERLG